QPTTFRMEKDDCDVVTITLDRPERLNALTFEVYEELRDAFRALADEPGLQAVVITGAGRAFCSGGDVEEIIGRLFERDADGLYEFTRLTCDLILAIRRCPVPVIAALNGTTTGAGAVIAIACDVRIASETARIAFLFTKVGLSGADMGAAWLLPRIVGLGKATELLVTGEFVEADEAHRIGLYNRVVSEKQVLSEACGFARLFAKGPTAAIAATKRAIEDEWTLSLEDALENEARVQAGLMAHPDFREAYEAWREKRPPRFS
ncbi:MAG TPA: enoyl-CoA hydratase family protein, partial [Gemmatimonadota bacterium]|nr:enoyl-CoA hydratase family protein [Gemmatimonadota bacterium]